MKKKFISLLLSLALFVSLGISTFASNGNHQSEHEIQDNRGNQGVQDDIASQNTLDALYKEHLALRDLPASPNEAQADLLLALGVEKDAIDTITNGEVADLLKKGKIIRPEYLRRHHNTNLINELAESKATISEMLIDRGLNDEQVHAFHEKGLVLWNYDEDDNTQLLEDITAQHIHSFANNCWLISGGRALQLLGRNVTHFSRDTYYDNTFSSNIPELEQNLNDIALYAMRLYGRSNNSGTAFNYYLWGQENPSVSGRFHQGVDLQRGQGAALYNVTYSGATVIRKTPGGGATNALSVLSVYDPLTNVTTHYLHGDWTLAPDAGRTVNLGQRIGSEDRRGASGFHTHIQMSWGNTTSVPDENARVLSEPPYFYMYYYGIA